MRVRDFRQTFLGVWVRSMVRGIEFWIWATRSQVRDFTYVDDAVTAFLLAAAEPRARGRALNLGDTRSTSLRELTTSSSPRTAAAPIASSRTRSRRPMDIGDYVGDYSAISDLLGWRPTVSLEDGLARSLAYLYAHGERYW